MSECIKRPLTRIEKRQVKTCVSSISTDLHAATGDGAISDNIAIGNTAPVKLAV